MIRLNGKVRKASQTMLEQVFHENPSMNGVYPGESRYILDVFCIEEGAGEAFDLSGHPIYREHFSFGNAQVSSKRFIINESCISCGRCKETCPQQCIDAGVPYAIRQENCLHCGLCFENCPVGAVKKQ